MTSFQLSPTCSRLTVTLLALGSLAAAGCGDDDSSPPDARRPPDARPVADARPAADASGIDATPADATPIDAAAFHCGAFPDSLEPNDSLNEARTVAPDSIGTNPHWIYADWFVGACLSGTNEDWYRIEVSQIPYHTSEDFDGRAYMKLRASIKNTGVCAGPDECNGHVLLPEVPENTLTVSVYRASNMSLLYTGTSARGVVSLNRIDEALVEDLLISVSGPPEALYDYRLSIFIDVTGSEDECEC